MEGDLLLVKFTTALTHSSALWEDIRNGKESIGSEKYRQKGYDLLLLLCT